MRFVWENATAFSLAHAVSNRGLAHALRDAATWSGREPAQLTQPHPDGDGVLVAATDRPAWTNIVELGTV